MNIKSFIAVAVVALTAACTSEEPQQVTQEVETSNAEEAPQAPLGENEKPR